MRPKERIPVLLENMDWDYVLNERWLLEIPKDSETWDILTNNKWDIDYWEKYHDQRLGQVLINLGVLPDTPLVWMDEDSRILKDLKYRQSRV